MFRLLKKFHLSKEETKKSKFSLFFAVQHVIQDLRHVLAEVKLSLAAILLSRKYTLYRIHWVDIGFSSITMLTILTSGPRTDVSAGIVLVAFKPCSWQMSVLEAAMTQAAFPWSSGPSFLECFGPLFLEPEYWHTFLTIPWASQYNFYKQLSF